MFVGLVSELLADLRAGVFAVIDVASLADSSHVEEGGLNLSIDANLILVDTGVVDLVEASNRAHASFVGSVSDLLSGLGARILTV